MPSEILTNAESYAADKYAGEHGVAFLTLMENAGRAVADAVAARFEPARVAVLCGPGNNGGDGFVAARHLKTRGFDVHLALLGERNALKGDAAAMAKRWDGTVAPLSIESIKDADVVVDALFGAGLARPLEGVAKDVVVALNKSDIPVIAIDVPSGLHGDLARPIAGECVNADVTVTFFRKKPAHVLMPGRLLCGDVIVADIGTPPEAIKAIGPKIFENGPDLWNFPWPKPLAHKYARGHCVIVSGPAVLGAPRLAAHGALRIGAGLVSVACPPEAVAAHSATLDAIMVKPFAGAAGLAKLLSDRRFNAAAIGPGCGVARATQELVAAVLESGAVAVLDADALTSFANDPKELFALLREPCVLTPHEGEFEKIFPGVLKQSPTRIEAARAASSVAKCTVLLKGPDTVIASPDGRVIVNTNAPPALATAGAGDVLTGMIAGLLAQGMDSFHAAACAAWLHGEAANIFGPGLISEDLPELLPVVLSALRDETA